MAITTVKSTYSLDVKTVRALDSLARRWKTSKSEALRRVIMAAAQGDLSLESDPVRALEELQGRMDLSIAAASRWEKRNLSERQTFPRRNRQTK